MKFLVAGGSGFIGTHLVKYLVAAGHEVDVLTRKAELPTDIKAIAGYVKWTQFPKHYQADVVINLCGINLAQKRWSDHFKQSLVDSRVKPTAAILKLIHTHFASRPKLMNASAIGAYPINKKVVFTESSLLPDIKESFSARLCQRWEAPIMEARTTGLNATVMRFGVVLGEDGGMLAKLKKPFSLGLGVIMGRGWQFMPWIHIEDLCEAILFLAQQEKFAPVYNLVAPEIISNLQFSKQLAQCFKRPVVLKMPDTLVKLLFGQMGEELLLGSYQVESEALAKLGYQFKHSSLASALRACINKKEVNGE